MLKQLAFATAALAVSGVASATSVVLPTTNPVTLTYDSSIFKLNAQVRRCNYSDADVNCFDLALDPFNHVTSTSALAEIELSAPSNFTFQSLISYLIAGPQVAPSDVQLRFSNPTTHWRGSIVDLNTNATLFSTLSDSSAYLYDMTWSTNRVKISLAFDFLPGNFLTPSLDSTCASLSCMTPGHDTAYVSGAYLIATQAPEPSTYAMLVAGSTLLFFAGRRRQRR